MRPKRGQKTSTKALYLVKEHPEGEKGEKILVPVHFFGEPYEAMRGPQ